MNMEELKNNRVGTDIISGRSFLYTDSSFYSIAVRIKLKETVDADILQNAVDYTIKENPWSAYGIFQDGEKFYYHNAFSDHIRVRGYDGENIPSIGGKEDNGHLVGVFFHENLILIAAYHGLTDGKGLFFLTDSLLRSYVRIKEEGILPEHIETKKDINAEPFVVAMDVMKDVPPFDTGFSQNVDFFLIPEKDKEAGDGPRHVCIEADASGYMAFARKFSVKPAAVLVTMCARAAVRNSETAKEMIRAALPVDFRSTLGIENTFRNCAMPPVFLDLPQEMVKARIGDLAGSIQQQIEEKTTDEAKIMAVKSMAYMMGKLPPMSYRDTVMMFGQMAGKPMFTFNASYAFRVPENSYSSMVDGMSFIYPAENEQVVIEMVALPDRFCLTVNQGTGGMDFVNNLCDLLNDNGVRSKVTDIIRGNTGYVRLREEMQFK